MKEAQEFRAGNTLRSNGNLFIVLKATYNKGSRNASSMKLKLKNLETGSTNELVYRANDKLDDVVLNHFKMQYLYASGDVHTFMDVETFEQIELQAELLADNLNFLKEQMVIDVIMHGEVPVGIELPMYVELTVAYTEPTVRGDSSGKALKDAKLETGYEMQVPLYCEIGQLIKIDTRNGEFVSRVQTK